MRRRRSYRWLDIVEQLRLARARYEALNGALAPGNFTRLSKEQGTVRELRARVANYLPSAIVKVQNAALEAKIHEIRQRGTTPRNTLEKVFGRSLSQEAVAEINQIQHQQREPPTYVPADFSISELRELERKLAEYDELLTRSISAATTRETERRRAAEERKVIAEEREAKRRREQSRIKAMAAAHAGKTRQLAQTIRRKIETQRRLLPVCPYCGQDLGETPHADHIYPVAHGGLSTEDNMVFICERCNTKKGQMTLREFAREHRLSMQSIEGRLESLRKRF